MTTIKKMLMRTLVLLVFGALTSVTSVTWGADWVWDSVVDVGTVYASYSESSDDDLVGGAGGGGSGGHVMLSFVDGHSEIHRTVSLDDESVQISIIVSPPSISSDQEEHDLVITPY